MILKLYRKSLKNILQKSININTKASLKKWLRAQFQISSNFDNEIIKEELTYFQHMQHKIHQFHQFTPLENLLTSEFTQSQQQNSSKQDITDQLQKIVIYTLKCLQVVHQNKFKKYLPQAKITSEKLHDRYIYLLEKLIEIKNQVLAGQVNMNFVRELVFKMNEMLFTVDIQKMSPFDQLLWLRQIQTKIIYSIQYIMPSINQPLNITFMPKQYDETFWRDIVRYDHCKNKDLLRKKIDLLKIAMQATTAAVLNRQDYMNPFMQFMVFGMTFPYHIAQMNSSRLRVMQFYDKPDLLTAQKVWNLPETGMMKNITEATLQKIQYNRVFYVPASTQPVTGNIFEQNPNSIPVRILAKQNIERTNKQGKIHKKIIIHMHGGGFIAFSSFSQQTFLRKWANLLEIPIISIDYRMAPQHPFPVAPEDCFRVYRFIVDQVSQYFNISPENIILAGDSAGGNLVLTLMTLIKRHKYHEPKGMYAAYPACDLTGIFSKSTLNVFNDPIFYPSELMLCLDQYLKNQPNRANPLVSPCYLRQKDIDQSSQDENFPQKWPYTIFHVGTKDVLYDDSIKLAYKMYKRGIKVEVHACQGLPHGFLNMDSLMKECQVSVADSIKNLKKLLENCEK